MQTATIDYLSSFRLIDGRLATTSDERSRSILTGLRERLAGELVSDANRVLERLGEGFTLRTHLPGGAEAVTTREEMAQGFLQMEASAGQLVMWVDLTHLAVDGTVLAGDGLLYSLVAGPTARAMYGDLVTGASEVVRTTSRIAFFIDHDETGRLMTSEDLYMDPAALAIEEVNAAIPSRSDLLESMRSVEGDGAD
jgi:hypothetical protein